jgi:P27 family predicted phage terminase small subunit
MGAGRPPKPARLKVITGNPGKRRIPGGGDRKPPPARRPFRIKCPKDMKPGAKKELRRVLPLLEAMGVIEQIDQKMILAYCRFIDEYERNALEAERLGSVVKTSLGYAQLNPYSIAADRAFKRAMEIAKEYGITHASRSRLGVEPKNPQDAVDAMMFGAGR